MAEDIWHLLDELYTKSEGNSCGSQDSIIIIIIIIISII